MTRNPETQRGVELGKFRSPEELADALEQRSKIELAKKIRNISRQVESDSSNLREKLQRELTAEEQQEVRETLPDSGIEQVLNKGLTTEEKQNQIGTQMLAGIVGAETASKLSKFENYFNSIKSSWDVAKKLFNEGKYLAAIGVFLSGLFGRFNLKDWEKKQKVENEEKKDENTKKTPETENININKQRIVAVILTKISGKEKKEQQKIPSILNNEKINKKTFNDLKNFYSNNKTNKELYKKLEISQDYKDKEIIDSLEVVLKQENLIDNILKDKYPEWREKELGEIFEILFPHLGLLRNISEITSIDDLKDKFNFGEITISDGSKGLSLGDSEAKIEELKKTYKGLNGNTLFYLKSIVGNLSYKDFTYEGQKGLNEEEKEFLKNLKEYGKNIEKILIEQYCLESKTDIQKMLQENPLKMGEIIDLFIITGGKVNNFNDLEKSYIYLKMIKIIEKRKQNILLGSYYSQLVKAINEKVEGKQIIPDGVKNILSSIFGSATDVVLNYLKGRADVLLGIIKDNPLYSAGVVAAITLALIIMPKVSIFASAKAVLITGVISALITAGLIKKDDYRIKKIEEELEKLSNN